MGDLVVDISDCVQNVLRDRFVFIPYEIRRFLELLPVFEEQGLHCMCMVNILELGFIFFLNPKGIKKLQHLGELFHLIHGDDPVIVIRAPQFWKFLSLWKLL